MSKKKIVLIICILVAIIICGAMIAFAILKGEYVSNLISSENANDSGVFKLLYEKEKEGLYLAENEYAVLNFLKDDEYIIDRHNIKVANKENIAGYLGDGYVWVIDGKKNTIQTNEKNIVYEFEGNGTSVKYKDGIVYCSCIDYQSLSKTYVYDLKNKKEVYTLEGISPVTIYGENFLKANAGYRIFNLKTGEEIASKNDNKLVFPTVNDYYYEVNYNDNQYYDLLNIKVISADNEIINTINKDMLNKEHEEVYLHGILPNGFIILRYHDSNKTKKEGYELRDNNNKKICELPQKIPLRTDKYFLNVAENELINKDYAIIFEDEYLGKESNKLIFSDGKNTNLYRYCKNQKYILYK